MNTGSKPLWVLLLPLVLSPLPVSGAYDMFLKISGIEGESTDARHAKEIVVLSFSQGVSVPPSLPGGTGGGKATFTDLSIVKQVDKSTPLLYQRSAQGTHFPQAVLTLRSVGGSQVEFYKITLTDVLISSVQTGGSSGGDNRPVETLTLNYAKIEWQYVPVNADGSAATPVNGSWDLRTNTP